MKSTGIIRRIDDLGRVVIPKEIRRTIRVHEGDPLEIFLAEDGGVLFKKYSYMKNYKDLAENLIRSFDRLSNLKIIITDTESVLAASVGLKKTHLDKPLSEDCFEFLKERYVKNIDDNINLIDRGYDHVSRYVPIISQGESVGGIFVVGHESIANEDAAMLDLISNTIASSIEE